ncbi:glycoside hydrolase family 2 protein [Camelliibacillus cellulosilyticus]|uniref:Glycoside hydrolase family 2 protein n=1 Tax=Camelliibacillus cellulosilyticus TaxID=2174486 RepID=A0ABV9GLW6_9BACL
MTTTARDTHPRPQFTRKDWINLNGTWAFSFDDENKGEKEGWFGTHPFGQTIEVPYTYETKASGIGDETFHPYVWYQRTLDIPEALRSNNRVLLHFNGSDYLTKVWVNGHLVGRHQGGYTKFSFDITDVLKDDGAQDLVVKVEDSLSCEQPRGKQRWIGKNFGCWYVQTTGIWQTVWLEFVPETYLASVKITPDADNGAVCFEWPIAGPLPKRLRLQADISFEGQPIRSASQTVDGRKLRMTMPVTSNIDEWKIKWWHPAHPHLYDVTFSLFDGDQLIDKVTSYFGMRKISIENGRVLLNNHPIYQKLILDQGYWPTTGLTPPSEDALIKDIDAILAMGFNGVRKHQKVEDPRFLYWCDKKGLLVWSEMAAAYEFSSDAVEAFTKEWTEIVRQNYNHPSIITWVPFNESWGVGNIYHDYRQQQFTEAIYSLTKALDPMRPVIVNDGWEHTVSDILTLHDYEEAGKVFFERYADKEKIVNNTIPHNKDKYALAKGYAYKGQPIMISEYGGIAFKAKEGWGYGNQVETEEEFLGRYRAMTQAIKDCDYISGYCYTQITDVQQEINGLLTENREPKVAVKKVREINQ